MTVTGERTRGRSCLRGLYWKINTKKRRLFTILVFLGAVTYFSITSIISDPNYLINFLIIYFMVMGWYVWCLWELGIIKEWTTGKHRSRYVSEDK